MSANQEDANLRAGNLFSVQGLVAVITGGGSGLGAAMARALALNGASKVFILGRREESLKKVASSLSSNNDNNNNDVIIPIVADVTSKDSLSTAYTKISAQTKHIDVLIANSGTTGPQQDTYDPETKKTLSINQLSSNLLDATEDEWSQTFKVNVVGVQLTVATFLPLLDAANKPEVHTTPAANEPSYRSRPQIITTGSIAGFHRLSLGYPTYGPSKSAMMHLSKSLAALLVEHDIRVNVIAPGPYLSEMTQSSFDKSNTTATHNVEGTFPKSYVPATRTGDDQDIAGAVLFLCSRAGAFINGNVLITDGGRLGVMPSSY